MEQRVINLNGEESQKEQQISLERLSNTLLSEYMIGSTEQLIYTVSKYGFSSEKGIEATSEFIHKVARAFGVEIRRYFVPENLKGEGGYSPETRDIAINPNSNLSVVDLLVALLHELRHAYQYQVIKNSSSDFGETINYALTEYTSPDDEVVNQGRYLANYAEIDAVRFSHMAVEKLLEKVNIEESEKERYLSELHERIEHDEKNISSAEQFTKESYKIIREYANEYGEAICSFFKNPEMSHEERNELMKQKIQEVEEKYSKDKLKIKKDKYFYFTVFNKVFNECSLEELARHAGDPEIYELERLEKLASIDGSHSAPKIRGTYWGSRFEQLKDYVGKAKTIMSEYGIEYDEKDNGKVFTKFLEEAPEIYSQLFEKMATGKLEGTDKKAYDLIFSLTAYQILDSKAMKAYIYEKFGMKKIKKLYEESFKIMLSNTEHPEWHELKYHKIDSISFWEFINLDDGEKPPKKQKPSLREKIKSLFSKGTSQDGPVNG